MTLDQYLKDKNVSTRDFAKDIDVTTEAVRLYRRGLRFPRLEVLRSIMTATNGRVTANDFMV
jgi:transcriptional regulator with XRE-family HTH domain